MSSRPIEIGRTYSNGAFGNTWEVRRVEALEPSGTIVYRVLVGRRRRRQGQCSDADFRRWARYEVVRNENTWERLSGR
jgi:hypothetical protein